MILIRPNANPRGRWTGRIRAIMLGGLLTLVADATPATSFQGIGVFPDPAFSDSLPNGLSGDGTWVVGRAQVGFGSGTIRLFRWSEVTGLQDLGRAVGEAVSNDGSVVVGRGDTPPFGAIRWTHATGIVDLGSLGPFGLTEAQDVSADGSVVVGISAGRLAFKWTEATGIVALPSEPAQAFAVSADGSIVVGESGVDAVLWAGDSAPVPLGSLPGAFSSTASGVSPDGTIVVGRSGNQAFLWTEEGGIRGLGFTSPDDTFSGAADVSADGAVVAGLVENDSPGGRQAMIWDPINGMRILQEVLEAELDLTGWFLGRAAAVSDDGRTVIGWGSNPDGVSEGWIAVLPPPVVTVDVDIKPGSEANSINPLSRGVIPVAILGTETLNVADVDGTTLAFGPGGALVKHPNGPHMSHVNSDGIVDLLAHFITEESRISPGDVEACVTGETLDGTAFEGCDVIRTVPGSGMGGGVGFLFSFSPLPPTVTIPHEGEDNPRAGRPGRKQPRLRSNPDGD